MNYNFFFNLIISLTLLQGYIYSFIFLSKTNKNFSQVLLGLFLLTSVGPHLGRILFELSPKLAYFPANFLMLSPVLFFLYSKSVLGVLTRKDYLHLIPGVIDFLFSCLLFIYPNELAKEFYDKEKYSFTLIFFVFILPVYYIIYASKSILIIKKYRDTIPKLYSINELNRLNWIKIICYVLIIANIFDAFTSFFVLKGSYALQAYLFSVIITCITTYWISIYGLNQRNLLLSLIDNNKIKVVDKIVSDNHSVVRSEVKKEQIQFDENDEQEYQKIVLFFNTTKIYKDKEINLFKIGDLLQMPYRDVSNLINNYGSKNFSQFLNEFRVNEAIVLLKNPDYDVFNLSGIANEVGFGSRSTFFSVFKSVTGKTPNDYRSVSQKV
jgi:AraC-like DNA-binding protein